RRRNGGLCEENKGLRTEDFVGTEGQPQKLEIDLRRSENSGRLAAAAAATTVA
ncbi:hypothetical protein U1Q18_026164, partial [Sarracenia purpurea var. burkii]